MEIKEAYLEPELELIRFRMTDVITESCDVDVCQTDEDSGGDFF